MSGMTIDDALDVARALKRAPAAGGGCARLYDTDGQTRLIVSWAPADGVACIVLPDHNPVGGDSVLSIPGARL